VIASGLGGESSEIEKDDQSQSLEVDFSKFSYSYTCLIVFFGLMLMGQLKNLSIFVKINTFGVVFTIVIIFFIC